MFIKKINCFYVCNGDCFFYIFGYVANFWNLLLGESVAIDKSYKIDMEL